ncbi:hypothetical protein ACRAWD_10090 [Caulobacter segnis]
MKHVIGPMAGLAMSVALSGCAGLAADPVALAQAVKMLDEGCERTVDLTLDKNQPGGGSLKVTRACAPAAPSAPKP